MNEQCDNNKNVQKEREEPTLLPHCSTMISPRSVAEPLLHDYDTTRLLLITHILLLPHDYDTFCSPLHYLLLLPPIPTDGVIQLCDALVGNEGITPTDTLPPPVTPALARAPGPDIPVPKPTPIIRVFRGGALIRGLPTESRRPLVAKEYASFHSNRGAERGEPTGWSGEATAGGDKSEQNSSSS